MTPCSQAGIKKKESELRMKNARFAATVGALVLVGNAWAFDFAAIDQTRLYRGFVGGATETLVLSDALDGEPKHVVWSQDGDLLLAYTDTSMYSMDLTEAAITDLGNTGTIIDAYRTQSGQIFVLTNSGLEDLAGSVLIPTGLLPANPAALVVIESGFGVVTYVVAGESKMAAFRVDAQVTELYSASVGAVTDLAVGKVGGAKLVIAAGPAGSTGYFVPWFEPFWSNSVPIEAVEWPCSAGIQYSCKVVAKGSGNQVLEINPGNGSVTTVGSVPSGAFAGTRGMFMPSYIGFASDESGAPQPPRIWGVRGGTSGGVNKQLPGTPTGARMDFGDSYGIDGGGSNGDGAVDFVVARYSPSGANTYTNMVEIYRYQSKSWDPVGGFIPYADARFGATVALTDLDGAGSDPTEDDEILTGPGPGPIFGPQVRAWRGEDFSTIAKVNYFAYGTLKFGVNVAGGSAVYDKNIYTGAGPGAVFAPHVRGWDFSSGQLKAIQRINLFAFNLQTGGAEVGAADLDGDGFNEFAAAPGPMATHAARVRGFNYDGRAVTQMAVFDFLLQGGDAGGNPVTGMFGARFGFSGYSYGPDTGQVYMEIGPDPNVVRGKATTFDFSTNTQGSFRQLACSDCSPYPAGNGL